MNSEMCITLMWNIQFSKIFITTLLFECIVRIKSVPYKSYCRFWRKISNRLQSTPQHPFRRWRRIVFHLVVAAEQEVENGKCTYTFADRSALSILTSIPPHFWFLCSPPDGNYLYTYAYTPTSFTRDAGKIDNEIEVGPGSEFREIFPSMMLNWIMLPIRLENMIESFPNWVRAVLKDKIW